MLFTIEELLTIAKEKKASDVHVTVGLPPRIRINGELVDLDYPKMTPADCEELILSIMDERQKELFKDRGELDFSFSSPNIGRYRVNVFRQRGSVACAIDPDVILVGEMRDLETISTAITAAETGHLVFSTLHTIGAAATIDRIIDVFPPHHQQQIRIQLAVVLEAVISQQLIPTADKQGRVAAFEVMHGTIPIKNLIREAKTYQISSVLQTARKEGMLSMDDALLDLYNKGLINAESAMGYAQDVNYVAKRVNQYY